MLSIVNSLSEIKKVFIASFTSFIPTAFTANNASFSFSRNYFIKFFFYGYKKVVGGFRDTKIKFSLQFVQLLK